jgi:hypothetical protein
VRKPEEMTPEELQKFVQAALDKARAAPLDPRLAMWKKACESTRGLDRIRLK